MISNRCARKSLVTNCNSIISKNYLRFLVDSNETTNKISIQLNVADYTPIEVKDLPQAIQDALTKNFSEYTVKSAAYQEDEDGVKIYQVTVVDEEGTEANIFFTEKGEIIE